MGKLPLLSDQAVSDILAQHGSVRVRQRGSHVVMQKSVGETTATVPVPLHSELKKGTLLSIIRQFGLGRECFEPRR